ncbi:Uncharacterised protein [Enterobacter hormaechei]|nr:Uncharacterised protein [Enterobacter hormaechei]
MNHEPMMHAPPVHTTTSIMLITVVHCLKQITINENLTPDKLVGGAGIVRDSVR